jgi:hypothetical protein
VLFRSGPGRLTLSLLPAPATSDPSLAAPVP